MSQCEKYPIGNYRRLSTWKGPARDLGLGDISIERATEAVELNEFTLPAAFWETLYLWLFTHTVGIRVHEASSLRKKVFKRSGGVGPECRDLNQSKGQLLSVHLGLSQSWKVPCVPEMLFALVFLNHVSVLKFLQVNRNKKIKTLFLRNWSFLKKLLKRFLQIFFF